MPSARAQIAALIRNGLLHHGADPGYADGDDAAWLAVDWPQLQRTLHVDGQEVNVLDTLPVSPAGAGDGGSPPPLLFVHGWSSNWQVFLLNIAAFMDSHRCIAVDLPGFGASPMPPEPLSIQGYARTVDAVCDALGVERVSVIGHSMGGFIGAELALSHGTRVDRLALLSAAGLSTESLPRLPLLGAAWLVQATVPYARRFESPVARRPRLRRAAMQWVVRYPERLSAPLAHELVASFGRPGFVDGLRAIVEYGFRDRLPMIEMPVLILWGRDDLLVPVSDAEDYADLIGSNARVVVFDDTGHLPMLERPTRCNTVLRAFFAGDPLPEAGVAGVNPA